MSSIGHPRLVVVHVIESDSVIHACSKKEISGVVELIFPDRLSVVCDSVNALFLKKVPDFDGGISSASGNENSLRMEAQTRHPVFMSFSVHQ